LGDVGSAPIRADKDIAMIATDIPPTRRFPQKLEGGREGRDPMATIWPLGFFT